MPRGRSISRCGPASSRAAETVRRPRAVTLSPMKRRIRALPWRLVVLATLFTPLAARPAGHAHEHGVARLDVAVEGTKIMVMLDTPLDNLVGFEHEPRNDAEHQKADAAVSRLKA